MKAVFADTFYWIALTDLGDPRYSEAVAPGDRFAGIPIVTTDEVLSEFLTFFASHPRLRDRAARTVGVLLRQPGVSVIPQSRDSFLAGWELYRARPDKGYSLTDCTSMQTMRREELTQVLTPGGVTGGRGASFPERLPRGRGRWGKASV